jgi:hypothetical protein
MDLVDQIKNQFSDADINQLSSLIGANEGATRSAVGAAVPTLLSALSGLVSSGAGGAQKLAAALGQSGGSFGNVASALSDRTGTALEKGTSLLNSLLPANALQSVQNGISRFAGVAWGGCQKLLGLLMPTILGSIASRFGGKPVNAQSLASFFSEQRASIANALPAGLSIPDVTSAVSSAAAGVGHAAGAVGHAGGSAARSVAAGTEQAATSANRWLLPVLVLLALALVAWWLWPKAKAPVTPAVPELSAAAAAWKNDVTGAASSLTETLGNIKDAASVDAAVPKLQELDRKLGDARARLTGLPTDAQTALSSLKPTLETIKSMVTRVLAIPGATEKLKPLLDSIVAKLSALVA